ncbi:RBP29 / RNA-binding protein 29 [Leishmania donovani]|uniref:RNA recognition motif family protein n=1 Tax=Leishmania donovani TaxID=5661 RepID=A0A504YAZ7_LEIDO|nr:RNA recognition motif family protein [Leishmania donovani]CAJ1987965.1 RBP29 / RNA-binding protein 29 [Leishmania donovani]VDZ43852.1 RNA-binding_protein_29_putative/GeneDB:LmjF.18.0220 [Leishmania donovani]
MSGTPMQTRFGCYIGNIDRSVTIDMLKQVFCQCGTIIDCSLNGREGDPYRFGFIDFATEDDRARAMKYNGFTLVGRKLKVGVSKGNVNKPEGYATGNGAGGGHSRMGGNRHYNNDGGMMMSVNGLSPQQQMEARLLLQFLQEGKMDPRQLSPAQQQLLITCLGHGNSGNAVNGSSTNSDSSTPASAQQLQMGVMGSSAMQSSLPLPTMHNSGNMMGDAAAFMPNPNTGNAAPGAGVPMMGGGAPQGIHINMGPSMMDPMSGGYGMMPPRQPQPQQWGDMPINGPGMYPPKMCGPPLRQQPQVPMQAGQQQPYGLGGGAASISGSGAADQNRGGFINPPPAAETLKLREKQREQFFEVVRKDAEKYERKLQEKKAQSTAGGDAERSADSSASDDDEDKKPAKRSKKESSK